MKSSVISLKPGDLVRLKSVVDPTVSVGGCDVPEDEFSVQNETYALVFELEKPGYRVRGSASVVVFVPTANRKGWVWLEEAYPTESLDET